MQNNFSPESSQRLRELYDTRPYPNSQSEQKNPLLIHWINAANSSQNPILSDNSHILVAGCGTGAEAFVLAQLYPSAQILGIDFSTRSIELAREQAKAYNLSNIIFEVADLMDENCCSGRGLFDFVICYAVADYVLEPLRMLQNLAKNLSEKGVIYIACNSNHHPAERIRAAFAGLQMPFDRFEDSPKERALLQVLDRLMGADAKILGLGNAPQNYLAVDIFAPIAHHNSIDIWLDFAQKSNLHFAGSMDAPLGLLSVADAELPMFYGLDKAALSRWMSKLMQHAGLQLLFSRQPPAPSPFANLDTIWDWKPSIDARLRGLPDLAGAPDASLPITLRFEGLADFVLYSTAYDLAVLRRCDGLRTLAEIRAEIGVEGNANALLACLFRGYHYGLLSDYKD